jgi:hypothetical protein
MINRIHIFIAIGLLLALAILGGIIHSQIPPRIDLPFGTTSTIVAAEFASTPDDIIAVIGSDRRYSKPLATQQYLDFPFIACYVALFIILALALRNYDVPGARGLAYTAIACAILAGACDVGENISILKTAGTPAMNTAVVRWFSIPKWSLVFLVMTIESLVFFFWPRLKLWWRLAACIVGGLMLFVGAGGLLFAALMSLSDITWIAEWITWAMGAMLLFLAARVVASSRQLRY